MSRPGRTATATQDPCDCRIDSLMFLDRVVPARQIAEQYRHVTSIRGA